MVLKKTSFEIVKIRFSRISSEGMSFYNSSYNSSMFEVEKKRRRSKKILDNKQRNMTKFSNYG